MYNTRQRNPNASSSFRFFFGGLGGVFEHCAHVAHQTTKTLPSYAWKTRRTLGSYEHAHSIPFTAFCVKGTTRAAHSLLLHSISYMSLFVHNETPEITSSSSLVSSSFCTIYIYISTHNARTKWTNERTAYTISERRWVRGAQKGPITECSLAVCSESRGWVSTKKPVVASSILFCIQSGNIHRFIWRQAQIGSVGAMCCCCCCSCCCWALWVS